MLVDQSIGWRLLGGCLMYPLYAKNLPFAERESSIGLMKLYGRLWPRPRGAERQALVTIYETARTHNIPRYYIFIERHLADAHKLGANDDEFDQQLLDHLAGWHSGDRRLNAIRKLVTSN